MMIITIKRELPRHVASGQRDGIVWVLQSGTHTGHAVRVFVSSISLAYYSPWQAYVRREVPPRYTVIGPCADFTAACGVMANGFWLSLYCCSALCNKYDTSVAVAVCKHVCDSIRDAEYTVLEELDDAI